MASWPDDDVFPSLWMTPPRVRETVATFGGRNALGQFWATHTSDLDGHTDYYWADDFHESRLYESSGALFEAMHELGYSGPATVVEWELVMVKESEVLV